MAGVFLCPAAGAAAEADRPLAIVCRADGAGTCTMQRVRPSAGAVYRIQQAAPPPRLAAPPQALSEAQHYPDLKSGDQRLRERLSALKLVVTESLGDGNCLFRSVSQQLYNVQDHHMKLRALAVQHMRCAGGGGRGAAGARRRAGVCWGSGGGGEALHKHALRLSCMHAG